ITGANLACNWTSTYNVGEQGSGQYRFDLDTAGVPMGEYPVEVSGSAIYVEPQTMLMFVEVREIYNTISYSANQLSIPLGESDSFSITWYDTDNSQPIVGQALAINCNWTSFHSFGEQNYTIVESSPGVYDVTIFTEGDDPLTAVDEFYTVIFDVELKDYQNHTFSIGVQVRRHNTQFILDSPIEQTPIGQDIVVLVFYQDTDLLQGITNGSGFVDLNISSPGVSSFAFSSGVSSLGDGHYNITIPSNQWGTIGWKNLTLTISWTSGDTYYSKVLNTQVRILGTDTDLYLETAPTATNYLNNFTFTVVYYDVINATKILNTTNNVFLTITPLTGGHSVTQSDFVVVELGASPGTYSFELNASLLGSARTFIFQIDFMWSQGVTPLYENQTMTVTLVVLGISTYVDYIPVQSTPYGKTANFSFSYINSLTTQKIANSSQLIVGLVEGGVPFTVSYDSGTLTFTIHIDTTALGVGSSFLNLNLTWIGEPFYEEAFQAFTVNVVERNTQLSHISFVNPQWGDIVSMEFIYTDLISGTSIGMTGTLTLDAALFSFYNVTSLGNGHYLVELDTSYFASNGVFVINASIVYTGSNFAADAAESFSLSVIERITQIGYESPDPTEYQDFVIFSVTFTDDGTGSPIDGATVVVDCSNSSQTLVDSTNYWVSPLGSGQYRINVSSIALGNIGIFELDITVSLAGAPFYSTAMATVNTRVIQRTTQILITQTPGEIPFAQFVVIKFKFTDFWSGATISIDKSHITLTHGGGMTIIVDGDYTLIDYGSYYEISFNSTILNAGSLVTAHAIQIAIDKSSGSPYYAPRSVSTSVTTVERPTQILFPLVEDTPFNKNITINFEYIDFNTGEGIAGATVGITFANGTPTYYIEEVGEGIYRVIVPSTQFGNVGTIYFNVTLSKAGVPFYSQRSATNVPAKIIVVSTTLIAEVPPIASQPVGQLMLVNITLTDTESGSPLSGASITTDWETLHLTDAVIVEIGGGLYRITINTTGLLAEAYIFTIQAELAYHFTSNITVTVTPGAATTEVILSKTTVYADWGNNVEIRLDVQDPYSGTLIPGMNVTLLWNGTLQVFTDFSNGTYSLDVDTSIADFGIYQPQITVSREFYQPRQVSFTIVVSKASGSIIPEQSLFNVITGTAHDFWIYLNDTSNGGSVLGATISMEWNNTVYIMSANGTPGYYVGSIDGVGFGIGQYELNLLAVQTNYIILDRTLDIFIVPVPTSITLPNDGSGFVVYFGEMLNVSIAYDDIFHGGYIIGANVSYTLGGTSGQLIDLLNGSYSVSIDTSTLAAQVTYLKITATYEGFETRIRSIVTNILPIPTVLDVDLSSKDGFFQDIVSYTLNFTDTLNDVFLVGATVDIEWEGGSGSIVDLGNGTYTISMTLNVTTPKPYDVNIRFTLLNYETATLKVRLDLVRIPTSIIGPATIEVPVNDTLTFYYTINNDVTNETITDVFALAYWEGLEEVVLETHANGSFMLVVLGDLPRDGYTIALSFTNDIYQLSPFDIDLIIRSVRTSLIVSNTSIFTTPNAPLTITVTYLDTDHNEGITGAEIFETSDSAIQYNPTLLITPGDNGTYILSFFVSGGGFFEIDLRFSRGQYEDGFLTINVESDLTQDQILAQTVTYTGGTLLILAAALLFLYIRVWSIPKQLRALNRMIKALSKGKVPRPASAPSRHLIVLAIVNEELRPSGLQKEPDEVAGESIEAHVPEVNELLDRLAEITGLGPAEVDAFRADLA
ncbi:MAG: hypothetical protein KAQ65_02925, partial [Candidatus Thorarchaeota archaeon]|nr:hypothetical protein [Candidatus Thorarchaeota archaeon]